MDQHDNPQTAPIASGPSAQLSSSGRASGNGEQETTAQDASRAEHPTFDKLKDDAASVAQDTKEKISETTDALGGMAARFAETQKNAGADRMQGFAHAMKRVAGDLENDVPGAGAYVRDAADGIARFSSTMRDRSVSDMVSSLNDFARARPAAFLGASVVAGFALSRFFMSSADRSGGSQPYSQHGRS